MSITKRLWINERIIKDEHNKEYDEYIAYLMDNHLSEAIKEEMDINEDIERRKELKRVLMKKGVL